MIIFSSECENAIQSGKLGDIKQSLQKKLESYTSFDNKGNNLLISKIIALILDIIHNIDIVDQLMADKNILQSKSTNDWSWFKQLRYNID